jgi:two-component system, NarL family, sensor kinase
VLQFLAVGLVATAVVGVVGVQVLRERGRHEGIRDAREVAELAARGIVEPQLTRRLLAGDAGARERMDRVVRQRVLREPVVRMKVWSPSGRIVYSDERRLAGSHFPLGNDGRTALRTGRPEANLSDLDEPENRFERHYGKLLEVYVPVRGPDGGALLSESYLRFSSVAASGRRLWLAFVPALVGGLLVLELLQVPLAWSLASRLRRGQREREVLWRRALDASHRERRRIARDLHDGVVQDLNAVSLDLSAAAREPPGENASALSAGATDVRRAIRQLRSALVEMYPPDLQREGLGAVLLDLAAPLSEQGIEVTVEAAKDLNLPLEVEALLFRSAQEGLLNIVRHAAARNARVRVSRSGDRVQLTVTDDGKGFQPDRPRVDEDHMGLRLLEDLVGSGGGRLEVESAPGRGSCLRVEVPAT